MSIVNRLTCIAIVALLPSVASAQSVNFWLAAEPGNIQGCIAADPQFTREHTFVLKDGEAEIILLESGLSFLGLGVQPPLTSLGNMVGYGREYITRAPWIMLAPATVIVLTTLSISLLGDWLRDKLDPTLR